ncbi:MAG: gliding motility-associated C-terminal domain-containing protein [Sphingobacteriaceae bacterium]|nr:gliding motility-associated C-terminal domain-containing protein [Sphingobacteriaceae bacterium]
MQFKTHKLLTQKGAYALFCVFLSLCSFSQAIPNLINNYSFESTTPCPSGIAQINKADFWFSATQQGSPDYFNSCNTFTTLSQPLNGFGYQFPRTGNAYGGLVTYSSPGFAPFFEFREYIENGLKQTLKPNTNYCVSYYVNLAGVSNYASANVGIVFSKDSIRHYTLPNSPSYVISYTPSIENTLIISDSINWTKIEGNYLATGVERFITIGNFRHDPLTSTLSVATATPSYREAAYYFIDDVSVTEIVNANASINDTLTSRCVSDSVVLGTDSTWDATYVWQSTAAGLAALSCTNCPNPIAKPTVTTKYYLTKQQCSATTMDSVTVVVLTPTTTANAGNDKTICLGDVVQIGVQDSLAFTSYSWQSSASLSCANCAMPFANPNVTTTYTVQRTECTNVTTDTVKIIIDDCDPTFVLPNVFSPNGDEINDTWGINFSTVNSHIKNFKMSIYDRWGLLVYSTNPDVSTPKSKWDGRTTAGIECNAGVYFYVITFSKNDEEQKLNGHLSLFK